MVILEFKFPCGCFMSHDFALLFGNIKMMRVEEFFCDHNQGFQGFRGITNQNDIIRKEN